MAKDKYTDFINVYKEVELLCRDQGLDYKDLEDKAEPDKQSKLRMCRYFRNYIQHTNGYRTFLSVTDEMIKFIESIRDELLLQGDIVKQHLGRTNLYSCKSTDKAIDILALMAKRKITEYPVIDEVTIRGKVKRSIRVITIHDIANTVISNRNNKIKFVPESNIKVSYTTNTTKMEDIPSGIVICTDDGTENGKLLGIVK